MTSYFAIVLISRFPFVIVKYFFDKCVDFFKPNISIGKVSFWDHFTLFSYFKVV